MADAENHNLLAPYKGARPAAPAWFEDALAHKPEQCRVDVDGAEIDLLVWGERGKPGLLLIHGSNAHAHWWDHIAPMLASDYRVAALSLSGMGESGWRTLYSAEIYEQELFAAAEAAGLYDAGKPVFIAHSFGGMPMATAAMKDGDRLGGAVFLDSGFLPNWGDAPHTPPSFKAKAYESIEAALARFRLMPPQHCDNPYIADHIARKSMKEIETADGEPYWTWSFDPDLWANMRMGKEFWDAIGSPKCPIAFVSGALSKAISEEMQEVQRKQAPAGTPFVRIPQAEHHVMIDQPLALVAAIRALLSAWPH